MKNILFLILFVTILGNVNGQEVYKLNLNVVKIDDTESGKSNTIAGRDAKLSVSEKFSNLKLILPSDSLNLKIKLRGNIHKIDDGEFMVIECVDGTRVSMTRISNTQTLKSIDQCGLINVSTYDKEYKINVSKSSTKYFKYLFYGTTDAVTKEDKELEKIDAEIERLKALEASIPTKLNIKPNCDFETAKKKYYSIKCDTCMILDSSKSKETYVRNVTMTYDTSGNFSIKGVGLNINPGMLIPTKDAAKDAAKDNEDRNYYINKEFVTLNPSSKTAGTIIVSFMITRDDKERVIVVVDSIKGILYTATVSKSSEDLFDEFVYYIAGLSAHYAVRYNQKQVFGF